MAAVGKLRILIFYCVIFATILWRYDAEACSNQKPEGFSQWTFGNRYRNFGVSRTRFIREINPVGGGRRAIRDGSPYNVGMNNAGGGDGFVDPVYMNSGVMPIPVDDRGYSNGPQYGPQRPAYPSHVRKKPGPGLLVDGRVVWRPDSNGDNSYNGGRYYYGNDYGGGNQPDQSVRQPAVSSNFAAVEKMNWLSSGISFGQIGGLTMDTKGNLVVFHRVDRVWNDNSFDETNRFRGRSSGPIMDDTLVTISTGGSIVYRWGRGLFFMPHGVFIDKDDYVWTTDVAMHQVFKFDTKRSTTPLLTLGTEFEPGVDERHFCKPAAVAIANDGTIFVADGYCNNRIVKFNANGGFLTAWGESSSELLPGGYPKMGSLSLPHSLSLHDSMSHLLVADRGNARVQIFNYNGTVLDQITDPRFASTVYAASYCQAYDIIYILSGPGPSQAPEARIFAVDGKSKGVIYSWRPQSGSFQHPHAMAVSKDCSNVFVGEIGPNKLWRFDVNVTGRHSTVSSVQTNFAAGSAKKPQTVNDNVDHNLSSMQSMSQLVAILTIGVAVPVLVIAAICLCIRFRKRGGFRAMNMTASYSRNRGSKKDGGRIPLLNGAFRDRNGFQRLSTEDVDAMDELSDESETEDMLYPVAKGNTTVPQKA